MGSLRPICLFTFYHPYTKQFKALNSVIDINGRNINKTYDGQKVRRQ